MIEGFDPSVMMKTGNVIIGLCAFMVVYGISKIVLVLVKCKRSSYGSVSCELVYSACLMTQNLAVEKEGSPEGKTDTA